MAIRRWFFVFFLVLTLPVVFPADAHALFQLTASPRRGGQSVRFEGAEPGALLRNEEVTVAVASDRGSQYRILQTLYQPLTNEMGNSIPADAFIEFSPSNSLGTLRTKLETPISMGQKQVYTSNATGDSDEFVLVLNVRVPENQPGGIYHTQLTLTAEPVNAQAGLSPSTVSLDVRVEINPKFHLTIQNTKGTRTLDFAKISKESPQASDVLNVQIDSNIGTRYRLLQQLTDAPVSAEGETLTEGALMFRVKADAPVAASQSVSMVYQSNEYGAGDMIPIEFFLNPDPSQKAGLYTGSLSFRVESNSPFVPQEVINLPVKINIESIFSLETQMQQGGNLNFGMFKTGQEKQERSVLLKVRSNLGQPYQVSQLVPRKMTNAEGGVISKDHFLFFADKAKTGILSVPVPTPVEEGETVVFTSDRKGTPEEFVLNYVLTVPSGTKAGSYNSELKYSITTL